MLLSGRRSEENDHWPLNDISWSGTLVVLAVGADGDAEEGCEEVAEEGTLYIYEVEDRDQWQF